MADATSTLLQIVDMGTGDHENDWGDVTDANLTKLENAIAGSTSISSTGGTTTLTNDQARSSSLIFSGSLSADHTVVVAARAKAWIVRNNHTLGGYSLKFKVGAGGTPVTVPQGTYPVNLVWTDGTDVYVAGATESSIDSKIAAAAKVYIATVGGTANALTLDTSPTGYARTAGNVIIFTPASDNTGATTINPETLGAANLLKQTAVGAVACTGGELKAGQPAIIFDDGSTFQILRTPDGMGATTSVASAATVDLGASPTRNILITGTTAITSFGSSASTNSPVYHLRFAASVKVTHDATYLILPGGIDAYMQSGDTMEVEYLGTSVWLCRNIRPMVGYALIPPGSIMHYAASTPPNGFLECNGSAVSRTTYAALFAAIGTTWGSGDGSTTFNIPDARGYFLRGYDNGAGNDSGRAFASTQTDAFQGHHHQLEIAINISAAAGINGPSTTGTDTTGYVHDAVDDGVNGTPRTADETRPKNIAVMICIKT